MIERGSNWRAGPGWRAKSFRLLLRSPGDMEVQTVPPILMWLDFLRIVSFMVVIILVALPWILILHRRLAAHQAPKT